MKLRKTLLIIFIMHIIGALFLYNSDLLNSNKRKVRNLKQIKDFTWSLPLSTVFSYDVDYESLGSMLISIIEEDKEREFQVGLTGKLEISVVDKLEEKNKEFYEIFLKLHRTKSFFEIAGKKQNLKKSNGLSARAVIDSSGMVHYFKPDLGSNPVTTNIMKTLLSVWRVKIPLFKKKRAIPYEWYNIENNTFGRTQSLYVLKNSFNTISDALRSLGLDPIDEIMEIDPEKYIVLDRQILSPEKAKSEVSGKFKVLLGVSPVLPVYVSGELTQDSDESVKTSASTSVSLFLNTTYKLDDVNMVASSGVLNSSKWGDGALLPVTGDEKTIEKNYYRKLLGSLRISDLLDIISDLEHRGASEREFTSLYLKLKAFLTLYPSDIFQITQTLLTANPDSRLMGLLLGAISATETLESEKILKDILNRRMHEPGVVNRVIPMLVLGRIPGRDTIKLLKDISSSDTREDVRITSDLALSIAANKIAERDPGLAKPLVDRAIRNFKSAKDEDERLSRLEELGNTGSDRILSLIKKSLSSKEESLRAKAVFQLRFVKSGEAEDLLISHLGDKHLNVRRSVAKTFSYRVPSKKAVFSLMKHFEVETEEYIHSSLLKTIWAGRGDTPQVADFLKRVAFEHPSERIRLLARGLAD